MQEIISDFLEYVGKERRFSPHTVLAYSNDLAQFEHHMIHHLGIDSITQIDHHDIRTWIISFLEDEKILPRSVNRKLSCLRSFYKHMMRNGIVTRNPMERISSLKTKKSLPLFLEQRQMDQLLDDVAFGDGFAGSRDRLIIELLYNTGMRRAELIGLRTFDVDFYNKSKVFTLPAFLFFCPF